MCFNEYFVAGNLTAMQIHIEKNGVNALSEYFGPPSTALYRSKSRKIAHFLLKNGADPHSLVLKGCKKWGGNDVKIANINVIRWCLEYEI